MRRSDAEQLAERIRFEVGADVAVVEDGTEFVVELRRTLAGSVDTWTFYDELDWEWLRPRIEAKD